MRVQVADSFGLLKWCHAYPLDNVFYLRGLYELVLARSRAHFQTTRSIYMRRGLTDFNSPRKLGGELKLPDF